MMMVAAGGITGLLAWCIHKVVTTPNSAASIHSQADIDPSDAEDQR